MKLPKNNCGEFSLKYFSVRLSRYQSQNQRLTHVTHVLGSGQEVLKEMIQGEFDGRKYLGSPLLKLNNL